MDNPFRMLIIITLLVFSLGAYFLVVGAFFPARVEKTRHAARQMMGRSFGLGFVNFFFFGAIAVALFSVGENAGGLIKGILVLPAFVILGVLAVLLSFGVAATVNDVGARIFPDYPAWKQTVTGSTILAFACALPFVGWFLLLPWIAFTGIGGTILGFFQKSE